MIRKIATELRVIACLCALLLCATNTNANSLDKPNILIIFTDDQGYADLGCFGSPDNQTPVLDQLATDGTKFTSFYAQPVCGPSRSALLTGRYPVRSKGWSMPSSEITFAEMLKEVGYQTACVGKWDVSNRKAIIDRMPNAQGFDYYFGALGANDAGKVTLHSNNELVGTTNDMAGLTRLYTDKAIDYLENQRDPEKPFLFYLAHTMMHTVVDASPKFKEKTGDDLYRAVVEEFDHETGRLLDPLEQLGWRENTLVIYTTDNGPWNQPKYHENKTGHPPNSIFWGDAGALRDGKASIWEGGVRAPCIMRWPGKIAAGGTNDGLMATIDLLPTFAALTGAKVPADRAIDGVNQLDCILGKSKSARKTYIYNPGSASVQTTILLGNAIREGDWKLISPLKVMRFLEDAGTGEWELYNLKDDIGETKDLADQYPEKVARLKRLLESNEAEVSKEEKLKRGKRGRTLPEISAAKRSVSLDFESGKLAPWKIIEGEFGQIIGSRDQFFHGKGEYNKQGKYYLTTLEISGNTKRGTPEYTGVIISPLFVPKAGVMTFQVGGGKGAQTYIALCTEDGKEVKTAHGSNKQEMRRVSWDIAPHGGKTVFLKIVDKSTASWGHITADNFQFDGKVLKNTHDVLAPGPSLEDEDEDD